MAVNKTINKRTKSYQALKNCIQYVLRDQKVRDGYVAFHGPIEALTINSETVFDAFVTEKEIWKKESGRLYSHEIISFHKEEKITPAEALSFGKELVEKWYPGFQTLIAVHQDKEHIHVHFVINTVSFEDGHKIHRTKYDLEHMKEWTNEKCVEKGFTVCEKGKHFDGSEIAEGEITTWSKDKYNLVVNTGKDSFLAECALAVIDNAGKAVDKESFMALMAVSGWNVQWNDKRKHLTFTDGEGHKVRDTNLSKTFKMDINKESLNAQFERTYKRNKGIQTGGYGTDDLGIKSEEQMSAGEHKSKRRRM